ncbi:hypothetical protein [Campylobacter troglodytis]|uniref:hypothetical protein n=1 Tax=Campylobacter troglodytis TaxID=654363 RepID=UPI00115B865C|nr:hypothetical protein [Campylobacter troglodytis]
MGAWQSTTKKAVDFAILKLEKRWHPPLRRGLGVGRHCETSLCEVVAIHKIHKAGSSLCGLLKTEDR